MSEDNLLFHREPTYNIKIKASPFFFFNNSRSASAWPTLASSSRRPRALPYRWQCLKLFLNLGTLNDFEDSHKQCCAEYHYAECNNAEYSYSLLSLLNIVVIMLKINCAECHYAECHYAECHCAEYNYVKCHYAEYHHAEHQAC